MSKLYHSNITWIQHQDSVKERLRKCDDLPCYTTCSDFWADQCYVMDKNSIQVYISQDSELDPFAAFGLFMTSQATSIDLTPRNTDPTIDMLYRISLNIYTKILDQGIKCENELKQPNDRADNGEQATTSDYKERMKFIEKFKEDRTEEGKTMSWELCLLEGREKLKWCYKNSNSLRAAFAKYEKKKQ
ncbi:hypothetical protein HPULCUR_003943 [Helicostylum pulchrum]|uniref:Uncharacterized protein n=1 Tax=Helicostylum pulchrum TaxID=562976 RepID=A0ABP9XUT4_9FUNG